LAGLEKKSPGTPAIGHPLYFFLCEALLACAFTIGQGASRLIGLADFCVTTKKRFSEVNFQAESCLVIKSIGASMKAWKIL